MIEFRGELSDYCKNCILKTNRKNVTKIALVVALIAFIPVVIALCSGHWIMLITVPVYVAFVAFAGISPKDLSLLIPDSILIDNEEMVAKSSKFNVKKSTKDIKAIYDMGECYKITFKTMPFYPCFLCQKNLIIQGSVEDFERFFADKIVKTGDGSLSPK